VNLKVTDEEQEKMRQGIEKKQEATSARNSVAVMFHDSRALWGVSDSFCARGNAVLSLLSLLKVSISGAHSSHRTRRRASPYIEKFYAEVPDARSAWFVFGASPNSCSQTAAATTITTMTEQRRCAAA